MSPSQDLLLALSATISSILILTGAIVSIRATRHYRGAQTVVRAVITTYGQRLARHEEVCQTLSTELGHLKTVVEKLDTAQRRPYESSKQTTVGMADLVLALKDTSVNIRVLTEALHAADQGPLNATLVGPVGVDVPRLSMNEKPQQMTTTEIETLKILAAEGGKTSRELQERVGRSREHFARLMKRLYERGYVDRDISQIPFMYRINENIAHKVIEGHMAIDEISHH